MFTYRELSHVLACLRYCQAQGPEEIAEMSHFDDIPEGPLEDDQVDQLAERLNCDATVVSDEQAEPAQRKGNGDGSEEVEGVLGEQEAGEGVSADGV